MVFRVPQNRLTKGDDVKIDETAMPENLYRIELMNDKSHNGSMTNRRYYKTWAEALSAYLNYVNRQLFCVDDRYKVSLQIAKTSDGHIWDYITVMVSEQSDYLDLVMEYA